MNALYTEGIDGPFLTRYTTPCTRLRPQCNAAPTRGLGVDTQSGSHAVFVKFCADISLQMI